MHRLEVQHRWYVDPGTLHGARILTVLHNPTSESIAVTVAEGDPSGGDNLGSDPQTGARATSDGSGVFSPASRWGVTSDDPLQDDDPALAHVWDGPGGAIGVAGVKLGGTVPNDADILYWDWNVTVPPGGTSSLVSYEIQAAVPSRDAAAEVALAAAQAEAREHQSPASLYVGMSATEIAGTLNWAHPSPSARIAPVGGANSATPVRLDGSGSTGASGLPQCMPSYSWKADEGATGSGPILSHVFSAGKHSATLTVANSCGGSQSAVASFTVESALRLGKLKLNRRKGTASLKVTALGPGQLTLAGKGIKKQTKQLKKAGSVTLSVKPSGKLLKLLAKTGRAKAKVIVSLKLNGGPTTKVTRTIALKMLG